MVRPPDLRPGPAGQGGVDGPEGRAPGPTSRRARSRAARRSRRTRTTRWSSRTGPASSRGPRRTARRRSRRGASSAACRPAPRSWPARRDGPASADSSSRRGVPIALAASTTTLAGSKCSPPSRSSQVAPVTRPAAFVSRRRTRAPVTSRAPSAIAFGQCVRSVDALAPSLQPCWQVPRWTHGRRPSYGTERIELGSGHQCQPRRVWARATFRPPAPIGSGGSGGSSPPGRVGRVAAHARDAEVAVAPLVVRAAARRRSAASRRRRRRAMRTRKSEGSIRGQAPAKMSIEPPTAGEHQRRDRRRRVSSIG